MRLLRPLLHAQSHFHRHLIRPLLSRFQCGIRQVPFEFSFIIEYIEYRELSRPFFYCISLLYWQNYFSWKFFFQKYDYRLGLTVLLKSCPSCNICVSCWATNKVRRQNICIIVSLKAGSTTMSVIPFKFSLFVGSTTRSLEYQYKCMS